jgi:O-antigen/teichoic acid export membrane protein
MIIFNALTQLFALGAVLVLQTGYMMLVARMLGPEDFGRFSFCWAVIQILLIGGDSGLHNTALKKISANREGSLEISRTFFGLKVTLSAVLFALVLVIAFFLNETDQTRIALVIFGVGMFFHCISMGKNVVFQSHGKLYYGSLNILLIFSIQALFGSVFVLCGGRLIPLSCAYLIGVITAFFVNYRLFTKNIHAFEVSGGSAWRKFAGESVPVGLSTFLHALSSRLGITLLAFLAGPYQTGIFSAAIRIPQALHNIPGGIFSSILPAMAAHQDSIAPVRRLFRRSFLVMLVLSIPGATGLYFLSGTIVQFLYGEEYTESVQCLRIAACSLIPVFLGMSFSHVLLSQHRLVHRLPWVAAMSLVFALISNFVLIPRLRSVGAAYSIVIAETILALGYVIAVWRFLFRSDPSVGSGSPSLV